MSQTTTSKILTIATEIAAKVSTVTHGGTVLTASVDVAPDFDLVQVKTRKIVVTPQSYTRTNATRGDSATSAKINIAVCEKIQLSDTDDRIKLMEEIVAALERCQISSTGLTAIITGVEFDPIYDAQLLRSTHVFISVCIVTVKVLA